MDELSKYNFELSFKTHKSNLIYHAIRLKFPGIKGLNVEPISNGDSVTVTFDDTGDYTREEVHSYLNNLKNEFKFNPKEK
jgi:hypothetical protein